MARLKVPSRASLAAQSRATTDAVRRAAQSRRSRSLLRDFVGFVVPLLIVAALLGAWNYAQTVENVRHRLWAELVFFGLVIWFGIAVVGRLAAYATRRLPEVLRIAPTPILEAFAWAAITVIAFPIAIRFRAIGAAVLVFASLVFYFGWKLLRRRFGRFPRLPLCLAAAAGALVLVGIAWISRDTAVEDADLAPPTETIPEAAALANALRPLLFFDRDERFPPVDIDDATIRGCRQSFNAEDCDRDPIDVRGPLDEYDYVKLVGTTLEKGERPGGDLSAYYHHVSKRGPRIFVDFWWYFAHNPSPVARNLLCGPALRWLSDACAEHPADWEGITVILRRCPATAVTPCVSAGGGSFEVLGVAYAQHEKVVYYSWEVLRSRWSRPDLAPWTRNANDRPLVFAALSSHASYAVPCNGECPQIVRPRFNERRNGLLHWTNNGDAGCKDCLQPLPIDENRSPTAWNAFVGRWGTQHCILFGSYCDVQRAPRSPSFQPRYRNPDCGPKRCLRPSRF